MQQQLIAAQAELASAEVTGRPAAASSRRR